MLPILEELCDRGSNFTDQSTRIGLEGMNASAHFVSIGEKAQTYKEYNAAQLSVTFQLNLAQLLVQLFLFWILLRCKPHIFAPKLEKSKVPKWPLGWVSTVWHETKLARGRSAKSIAIRFNNLDGAVMVRYCILGFKFSLFASIVGAFLMWWYHHFHCIPPDEYGGDLELRFRAQSDNARAECAEHGYQGYMVAQLLPGSSGQGVRIKDSDFIPVVVAAWVLTLLFVHLSMEEWKNFDIMRKEHLSLLACGTMEEERKGAAQAQRSVRVEAIPSMFRAVNGEELKEFFGRLFPHGVHSAVVQAETAELHGKVDAKIAAEGRRTIKALRQALAPQLAVAEQEREQQRLKAAATLRTAPAPCNAPGSPQGGSVFSPSSTRPRRAVNRAFKRAVTADDALAAASAGRKDNSEGALAKIRSGRLRSRSRGSMSGSSGGLGDDLEPHGSQGTGSSSLRRVWPPSQLDLQHDEDPETGVGNMLMHGRHVVEGVYDRAKEVVQLVQDLAVQGAGGREVGSSTGFVTFYTVSDRVAAEQMVLCQTEMSAFALKPWIISSAPEALSCLQLHLQANDINWNNAAVPHAQLWMRRFLLRTALLVAMLFWMIPIGLIQVWTNIDILKDHFHWIGEVQKKLGIGVWTDTLLTNQLPVFAQLGFLYILEPILEWMIFRIGSEKVKSAVQTACVGHYLAFSMVSIYCTIVGTSLLKSVCKALRHPSVIFDILRMEVPSVSLYFATFVMTRAGFSTPMLLLYAVLSAWEPHDKKGRLLIRPNFAMEATTMAVVMILGLTYCVIAPLVTFACVAYFGITALVYSWLFLYVYTPEYDCSGKMWPKMFKGTLAGLLVGMMSVAGIASQYVGPTSNSCAACLVLVLVIILLFPFFETTYGVPSRFIPLQVAREIDHLCQDGAGNTLNSAYYLDPVITCRTAASRLSVIQNGNGCFSCCRRRKKVPDYSPTSMEAGSVSSSDSFSSLSSDAVDGHDTSSVASSSPRSVSDQAADVGGASSPLASAAAPVAAAATSAAATIGAPPARSVPAPRRPSSPLGQTSKAPSEPADSSSSSASDETEMPLTGRWGCPGSL